MVDLATGEDRLLTQSSPTPSSVSFSPDGKWMSGTVLEPHSSRFREGVNRVAILNVETGEVSVRGDLAHLSIGTRGNDGPMWSPDGAHLYWMSEDKLLRASISTDSGVQVGAPETHIENRILRISRDDQFAIAADGSFILIEPPAHAMEEAFVNIVLNPDITK